MRTLKLLIIFLCFAISNSTFGINNSSAKDCLKITDWSVYGSWGAVAILNNVTIENSCGCQFKNIKVKVNYSSSSSPGNTVSQEVGVMQITVTPESKKTYLKGGMTFGVASQFMDPLDIKIIDAVKTGCY